MEFSRVSQAPSSEIGDNMKFPKIKSVHVIEKNTLLVDFSNREKRKYDITPLLDKEMFAALKNSAFFRNVRVDKGGYALVWNEDIDISEYEIYTNGTPI